MLPSVRDYLARLLTEYKVSTYRDDFQGLEWSFREMALHGNQGYLHLPDGKLLDAYVEMLAEDEEMLPPPPGVDSTFQIVDQAALIRHVTALVVAQRLAVC